MDESGSSTVDNGTDGNPLPTGFRRGKALGTVDAVDPIDAISGNTGSDGTSGGEPRKRRGRKPGSVNKVKEAKISVETLGAILVSVHAMVAATTKVEELTLSEEEGTQLAKAIAEVGKHYNVSVAEKGMAWTALLMAIGQVYGTRAFAYTVRKKSEKASTETGDLFQSGNIAQFSKVP